MTTFQNLNRACMACKESRIKTDDTNILVGIDEAIASFYKEVP